MNTLNDLQPLKTALNAQGVTLAHVVAFDEQGCIGKDNQLPWHVPEDLQHFKNITTGGVVLMGRKTFEGMGRALPNRVNYVITRNADWASTHGISDHPNIKTATNLADALRMSISDVKTSAKPDMLFIIGGGEIFMQTLPLCDLLYISRIAVNVAGDAFYPNIPDDFALSDKVSGVSAKNGIGYRFETYKRLP